MDLLEKASKYLKKHVRKGHDASPGIAGWLGYKGGSGPLTHSPGYEEQQRGEGPNGLNLVKPEHTEFDLEKLRYNDPSKVADTSPMQAALLKQVNGPNAAQVGATDFNALHNSDRYNQFRAERGLAERTVGSQDSVNAALRNRIRDLGDVTAEQFNMRGLTPQSGVFAESMARAIGREGAQAEAERQSRLSDVTQNYFGQGRGEMMAGRQAQFSGDVNRALANAGYQQQSGLAGYEGELGQAETQAGYQQGANQFNTGNDVTRALQNAANQQSSGLYNTDIYNQGLNTQYQGTMEERANAADITNQQALGRMGVAQANKDARARRAGAIGRGIGTVVGGVAGAIAGGPAGAEAGAQVGGGAGEAIGSYKQ